MTTTTDLMSIPTATITADQAHALMEEIRTTLEVAWDLVVRAYTNEAWVPLGYSSWADCCEHYFHSSRLRLPRSERAEVVAVLAAAGMSVREIAAATGESKSTIGRELAPTVPNGTPPTTLGSPIDELDRLAPSLLGISCEDWTALVGTARAEAKAEEWCLRLAALPEPVFEAALALCTAADPQRGATRENLERVLAAIDGGGGR